MISKRTKDALRAAVVQSVLHTAKAHGVVLGQAAHNKATSADFATSLAPVLARLRQEGYTSVRHIVAALHDHHIPTAYGRGRWHGRTVHAILSQDGCVTTGSLSRLTSGATM